MGYSWKNRKYIRRIGMAIRVLNACLYFCNYTIINFNLFTNQKIS